MSDENETQPTELDLLKQRADLLGVGYSNNIGVETLKKRIAEALSDEPKVEAGDQPNPLAGDTADKPVMSAKMTLRQRLIDEAMALVRVRITNMDPKKRDLKGEIFTVANEYIGTVKKFIPYKTNEKGYHLPKVLFDELASREFLDIRTETVEGKIVVSHDMVPEFGLHVLPKLTDEELEALRRDRAARGSID